MSKNCTKRIVCLLICAFLMLPDMALGGYSVLRMGDRGDAVLRMQQALSDLGYTLKVDGVFGRGTESAVLAFQRDEGLKEDGKAGDQTLSRLYAMTGGDTGPAPAASGQTATPAPTPTPPSGGENAIVTGGSLKLRTARSSSSAWHTIIPDKARVVVTEKSNTWCAVTYGGYSGFVMTKFLILDGAATSAPSVATSTPEITATPAPVETPPPGGEFATVTGGSLKLRTSPSASASWIFSIPDKTRIIVLKRDGKWCEAVYNNRMGYVMTEFLTFADTPVQATATPLRGATPVPDTSTPVGPAVSGVTARVVGGALRFSDRPDAEYGFMTYIPDQMVINVLEKGTKWCKVTFRSQTGYVLTEFLDFGNPTATVSPAEDEKVYNTVYIPLYTNCTAVVTGGKLKLHALDGNGTVILTIPDKAKVSVFKIGDFNSCVTYQGKSGYVETKYLTFTEGGDAPQNAAASSSTGKTVVREAQSYTIMEGSSCGIDQMAGAQVRDFFGGDDSIAMPVQYTGHAYITGYKPGKTQFTMVEYNSDTETTYLTTVYVTVTKRNYTTTFRLDYTQNTSYEKGWVQTNGYLFPVGMVHHVRIKITQGPADAKPSFRSTNPGVASVSADGAITAKSEGCAIIVVSCGEQSIPLNLTVYSATIGGGMNASVRTEWQVPLKMYKSPDEGSQVLTTIPFGRNLRLLQKGSTWCKTYYNGYTGYVKSDKLEFFCSSVQDASPIITPPPLKK